MASNGSDRPLVGLVTYGERARMLAWQTDFAMLQRTYVDAVFRAGGLPILLPPVPDGAAQLLDTVDALVLTGGADVDPARYGAAQHEQTHGTRPDRDAWELALCGLALDRDLPVLAVCRGMQILNVSLGGTLTQHLPDAVGHDGHRPRPGVFASVQVRLRAGTRAAGLLGERRDVPCSHHQAVNRIADGLDVVGQAADGTVEAVELPGRRFVLGVQWHPEEDDTDVRLFEALVTAASEDTAIGTERA